MKVLKVIGIVFVSILFLCFVGYVVSFMFCYKYFNVTQEEYNRVVDRIHVNNDVIIKSSNGFSYTQFKGIKFRNDFSKFERTLDKDKDNNSFVKYSYYDKDKKSFVNLTISYYDTDVSDNTFRDVREIKDFKLKDVNFSVNNILSNNYAYELAFSRIFDYDGSYSEIKGDYSGYIKTDNDSGIIYVYLYHNDKEYVFTFDGKGYFSMDYVTSFISSVVFI